MAGYLPEDLVRDILLRLPGPTIARFRCVSKSWRNFLSDPLTVNKILCFQNPCDRESLRILLRGFGENPIESCDIDKIHYSLHSHETLCRDKTGIYFDWNDFKIVGCCDGIFCLSNFGFFWPSAILLWNPATSETKLLPFCPVRPPNFLSVEAEIIGFGYDPQSDDYKVVQRIEFTDCGEWCYSEVYSLRNESWKTVNESARDNGVWPSAARLVYVHQQRDTLRNEKCYWFHCEIIPGVCGILSFDLTKEAFEYVEFPPPPVYGRHMGEDIDRKFRYFGGTFDLWRVASCHMSKGAIMAALCKEVGNRGECDWHCIYEIWGLLKFGVAESWTKLFAFRSPKLIDGVEFWKGGAYIYSVVPIEDSKGIHGGVFIVDPATEESVGHIRIGSEGAVSRFRAHVFTPTRVRLSLPAHSDDKK